MKEICIPIPHFGEHQIAEVEVTVNGKKKKYNYRVESFPWGLEESEADLLNNTSETQIKINHLRQLLDEYDDVWEIVQIFNPNESAKHIQVLFRQRHKELVS
jgi:hypothetical protein